MNDIRTRLVATLCVGAMFLSACGGGNDTIDLRLYPARLDTDTTAAAPEGWRRVEFAGSQRSRGATYLVASEPLLSGWNITAFRAAEEADGSRAVTLRLNAAGQQKMRTFAADEAHLKQPLALQIDSRWADFSPLLRAPGDRMTLYGFTAEEAQRLEGWLETR